MSRYFCVTKIDNFNKILSESIVMHKAVYAFMLFQILLQYLKTTSFILHGYDFNTWKMF